MEKQDNTHQLNMYQICLVHSHADRNLRLAVSKRLKGSGLTMMQWLLLTAAKMGPKGGITMSEAANTLRVTLPQVTALTNELIKKKLISQKVSRIDRRSRKLIATKAGSDIIEDLEETLGPSKLEVFGKVKPEKLAVYMETVQEIAKDKLKTEEKKQLSEEKSEEIRQMGPGYYKKIELE